MRIPIDRAGRLVIPQALREAARIVGGREVEVRVHDGVVEIEPIPTEVEIVRRGRIATARPKKRFAEPLRAADVEATRRGLRRGGLH